MKRFPQVLLVLGVAALGGMLVLLRNGEKRQRLVTVASRVVDDVQTPPAEKFLGSNPSPSPTPSSTLDPFAEKGALPFTTNLAVPFMSQAPLEDWGMPYQESCEEAAGIMVAAYFRDESFIELLEAKQRIDEIVAFEKKTIGYYEDTSATTSAMIYEKYFHVHSQVVPFDLEKARRAVANGYPVLIPSNGKTLPNPYFRNGGPPYHMLVMKGYTATKIITNDPGTHRGANFFYTPTAIEHSAHDWNNGDVPHGIPLMIVLTPAL